MGAVVAVCADVVVFVEFTLACSDVFGVGPGVAGVEVFVALLVVRRGCGAVFVCGGVGVGVRAHLLLLFLLLLSLEKGGSVFWRLVECFNIWLVDLLIL